MKTFARLLFSGSVLMGIWFVSGCASQPPVTEEEQWKSIHDGLYESFWVDQWGNPKSH
jgi:hypothetical protein